MPNQLQSATAVFPPPFLSSCALLPSLAHEAKAVQTVAATPATERLPLPTAWPTFMPNLLKRSLNGGRWTGLALRRLGESSGEARLTAVVFAGCRLAVPGMSKDKYRVHLVHLVHLAGRCKLAELAPYLPPIFRRCPLSSKILLAQPPAPKAGTATKGELSINEGK